MAILGFQLVSTLIGVSLLTKLSAHFSFTKALVFGGLYRCLLPSDKEILECAGLTKVKSKGKRSNGATHGNGENAETFHFPRTTPITLRKSSIHLHDIAVLPFYTELVWLVDFTVCALFVLFVNDAVSFTRQAYLNTMNSGRSTSITNSMHGFFAPSTINLNLVWSLFIVWFALSSLFSLFRVYIGSGENTQADKDRPEQLNPVASEWPLLLFIVFSTFVAAMLFLSLDTTFLDLRMAPAYGNLTFSLTEGTPATHMISWGMFQTCLATFASIVGLLFLYPSLQYGRVYVQVLKSPDSSRLNYALFYLNLFAPTFALLLWVIPLATHLSSLILQRLGAVKIGGWFLSSVIILARALSPDHIPSVRLLVTLAAVTLRFAMTKRHMQAFLDTAQTRLDRLAREPGRTTNREVQRIVASVFHCFNFAALQYLAPAVLLIGFTFSYKVSTGVGWIPIISSTSVYKTTSLNSNSSLSGVLEAFAGQEWESIFTAPWFAALHQTREAFEGLWEAVRCQAGNVCSGVLGFTLFWCLAVWQGLAFTSLAYHRFIE
nr:Transmembrane protein 161B [Hymenolepis microstoma]